MPLFSLHFRFQKKETKNKTEEKLKNLYMKFWQTQSENEDQHNWWEND